MKLKKAFTMAEAILVMTILGIIATIMITTLKPAEFKDKGMKILAKKVLSEIDTATTEILLNNSQFGTMTNLYAPNSSSTVINWKANAANIGKLYKGYLTATRTTATSSDCLATSFIGSAAQNAFFLKDGACVGIYSGAVNAKNTIFPGETTITTANFVQGAIFFDINGTDEPNVLGKDRFILPVGNNGIEYSTN